MTMRLLPAVILAAAVLLAPVLWLVLPRLLAGGGVSLPGGGTESAEISGVIIENLKQEGQILELEAQVGELKALVEELQSRLQRLEAAVARGGLSPDGMVREGDIAPDSNIAASEYTQVALIFDRTNFNNPLTVATPGFIVDLLGKPRDTLSDDCQPMTNPALKQMLVTEQVGPVTVTMLRPAIESLKTVFAEIRRTDPKLHDLINTAGALCVRQIRGTSGRYSNHSFGLAVDLNINGALDNFTDGKTQMGLIIIADFFHAEGWIWGAGFRREDSMHFEVSREKLMEWRTQGLI
ncbi:M15 family metallopeptidase [Tropicimonas sp.]|uniref:M15 family metallopeptidase n=1 Tax=Tropicimonas sp. TaxID=2067044 RepID=UPI003A8ABD98